MINREAQDALYLEMGERERGDTLTYPDDALMVATAPDGRRIATQSMARRTHE